MCKLHQLVSLLSSDSVSITPSTSLRIGKPPGASHREGGSVRPAQAQVESQQTGRKQSCRVCFRVLPQSQSSHRLMRSVAPSLRVSPSQAESEV